MIGQELSQNITVDPKMSHFVIAADRSFRIYLNLPGQVAMEKVVHALKQEGFNYLPRRSAETALEATHNAALRRFLIMGFHSPCLANLISQTELELALLLPCSVNVYETNRNQSILAISHPITNRNSVVCAHQLSAANEIRLRLTRAITHLAEIHDR